jgi:hypothetical protein
MAETKASLVIAIPCGPVGKRRSRDPRSTVLRAWPHTRRGSQLANLRTPAHWEQIGAGQIWGHWWGAKPSGQVRRSPEELVAFAKARKERPVGPCPCTIVHGVEPDHGSSVSAVRWRGGECSAEGVGRSRRYRRTQTVGSCAGGTFSSRRSIFSASIAVVEIVAAHKFRPISPLAQVSNSIVG